MPLPLLNIVEWILTKYLTAKRKIFGMAKIKVTQLRSRIGSTKRQKATLNALGLTKMMRTVEHNDTPQVQGMIRKVSHLVKVERV